MVIDWFRSGWSRVRKVLASTRSALTGRLRALFGRKVDESLIEELEEILFDADLGLPIIQDLIKQIRAQIKKEPKLGVEDLLSSLQEMLIQETAHLSCDI